MKKISTFLLCLCLVVVAYGQSVTRTFGPYSYSYGGQSLSVTVGHIENLWPGSDGLNVTIQNTGTASVDVRNAILVFNTSVVPSFNMFTTLGPISWPDFTIPPRTSIDDSPNQILVDTIMYFSKGNNWASTQLAAGTSFTAQYYFASNQSAAFVEQFAQATRFYPASWPQPSYFVPVTFNFTGHGGNSATVKVLRTSTGTTATYTMASGTAKQLRSGAAFSIWATDFIVGNTQYISQYTSAQPYALTAPTSGSASVTLPFTTATIPTGSFSVSVSGLPASVTTTVLLQGQKYGTTKTITMGNGSTTVSNVPQDTYTVTASGYSDDANNLISKATYNTQYSLSGTSGSTLSISYTTCNVVPFTVPGFPKYMAQGGITLGTTNNSTFLRTPMNVLFKYSGDGGDGDPGKVWDNYPNITYAIKNTIAQCRELETTYKKSFNFVPSDFKVLPVMVHYTANASGGWSIAAVEMLDTTHLRYHFTNLIRETQEFMKNKDADHPYPGSFIISPDLLGMLQQNYGGIASNPPFDYNNPSKFGSVAQGYEANLFTSKIFVNQKLAEAYKWCGLDPATLPVFTDDLKGYFQAITYLIHAVSNNSVTVGYQENMWATGTAQWVTDYSSSAASKASEVVSFLNNRIGLFNGKYKPDYLVLDRYEMDDFGGGKGNYCYNASAWQRTIEYGAAIASSVGMPWMLWQFPGGHLVPANGSEPVINYDQVTHGGAGGTWIFGDSNIGTSVDNISAAQLSIPLSPGTYRGATNVRELLLADNGYNWAQNQLTNLARYNVFSILWGGGNTTSITNIAGNGDDDGWLAGKVKNYLNGNQVYKDITCGTTTGTDAPAITDKLMAYPNPTDGELTVKVPGTGENADIEISTLVGARVYSRNFAVPADRLVNMNIAELPKGIYIISIKGGATSSAVKISKY